MTYSLNASPPPGVQMIAALMEDTSGGDRLLDATRQLCCAFSDLLRAAEPHAKEVGALHHQTTPEHYWIYTTPMSRHLTRVFSYR